MNDQAAPLRVLLATDDSEASRNAEAWTSRLRWSRPSVVDVLCVAGHGIARFGWGTQTYRAPVRKAVDQIRQSELLAAARIANEVGERLQRAGHTTRAWARQGDPAEEILGAIDAEQPDLVALGPRGRSGLAQLLLGSVSRQVIGEATRPVLVARRPPDGDDSLPRHMLVLVDGSLVAETAIEWILTAGWTTGANVTLLGLLGASPGVETDDPELASQVSEIVRSDAVAVLDRLAARFQGTAAEVGTVIESGHPLEGTLRAVEAYRPDLVVAARPRRRRGQHPFAEKLARYAPISVLIVTAP